MSHTVLNSAPRPSARPRPAIEAGADADHTAAADRHLVAVVIPAYKVTGQILDVLRKVGPEVGLIVVVDDACPNGSGELVRQHCRDSRVVVLRHAANQGVGGAVTTGYAAAAERGATIVVKLDGDGQMDPRAIPRLIAPILGGGADYTKGNRFYNPEDVRQMPAIRLIGNAGLSFLTKASSGYWNVFDPTNGFTALHTALLPLLPLAKIERRYFFESDMLFRLNVIGAKVVDIPMTAHYGDEVSNLHVGRAVPEFLRKNIRNFCKRFCYSYMLRGVSVASFYFVFGLALLLGGGAFGLGVWIDFASRGVLASSGTVMLAALPVILGIQLLLAFVAYDVEHVPREPLHPMLRQGLISHMYPAATESRPAASVLDES